MKPRGCLTWRTGCLIYGSRVLVQLHPLRKGSHKGRAILKACTHVHACGTLTVRSLVHLLLHQAVPVSILLRPAPSCLSLASSAMLPRSKLGAWQVVLTRRHSYTSRGSKCGLRPEYEMPLPLSLTLTLWALTVVWWVC